MKKLCVLLALVMALACLPAMAAEGDALLGHNGDDGNLYFNYCFAAGDTLYASGYSSVYTYRLGDPDLREYTFVYPADEESTRDYIVLPFASDGQLYALYLVTRYAEITEFEGAQIMLMTLNDDNTAIFEPVSEVDWSDLIEYYDENAYPGRPDCVLGLEGGKVFVRCYDVQGNGEYMVFTIDVKTGKREPVDDLRNVIAVTPYKDGALLVEQYDYNNSTVANLAAYDPASESVQPLAQVKVSEYSPLVGLGYDPDTDTVYCVRGGEICPVDLQAGELLAGVTDMPLENYGNVMAACVLPGGYFVFTGDGLAIRNLDPAQKAEIRLKINDNSWQEAVNNAYYRFANAHGDISTVLSREYSEVEHLIESMMNRDDSIDIYTLNTSSPTFEALYNRGYLMELDGNEKVKALADSMYPSLREALSTNGHLVALPLSAYSWAVGINEQALAKLGMTLADVPDNWSDFLDFLAGLEGKLTAESGVHLLYNGYTDSDVRYELMNMILVDYQYYVNATNPDMGYDTPLVHELLEKLEKIDFTALGCPSDVEDQTFELDAYDEESVLMSSSTGCNIGNFYSQFTPVLMRVTKDAPSRLVLDTTVLVINPFTRNADAALAFAGEVVDNLSTQTRYSIIPELNDPIRGDQNQAVLEELKQELEALRSDYESAPADEKQSLELDVQEAEKTVAYAEANNWDVSPTELEWYRAHDDNIIVSIYNWLYPDTSSDEEDGGISQAAEAEDLMEQYLNKQINLNDMLSGIDRKVQMRRLEGN